jgi:hypothetical protein
MRSLVLWLFLLVLLSSPPVASAQISWFPNVGAGAPSGNCSASQIYIDWTATSNLYTCKVTAGVGTWQLQGGGGGGGGTVTSVSSGNFSPLFNVSVATPTTTPAISFSAISQSPNLVLASPNGSSGNPTFRSLVGADLPSSVVTAGAPLTSGQLVSGAGSETLQTTDLSGDVTTSGSAATTIAANAVTYAKLQQVAANSIVGNPTNSTANATNVAVPSCTDTAGKHLNYTLGTGFSCGTTSSGGGATIQGTTNALQKGNGSNAAIDSNLSEPSPATFQILPTNGTPTLNLYSSFTDASNNDGMTFLVGAGGGFINTFQNGTGSVRSLVIGSSKDIQFQLLGTTNWAITQFGDLQGKTANNFISKYQGISTAGRGVPPIYGCISNPDTDRTASVSSTTIFTPPVAGGLFRFSVAIISSGTCATPGVAGVTVGMVWTDDISSKSISSIPLDVNGSTTMTGSVSLGNTTAFGTGTMTFKATSGQPIQFNTTLTGCTVGTAQYRIDGCVEQLR